MERRSADAKESQEKKGVYEQAGREKFRLRRREGREGISLGWRISARPRVRDWRANQNSNLANEDARRTRTNCEETIAGPKHQRRSNDRRFRARLQNGLFSQSLRPPAVGRKRQAGQSWVVKGE